MSGPPSPDWERIRGILDEAVAAAQRWPGRPGEHRWIAHGLDAYHAVNLREALKLVPDTGDWHGSLRAACEIVLRDHPDERPNQTAEQMAKSSREAAEAEVERAKAERDKARQALSLARSIAACGERILPADEAMFDAALSPREDSER